MTCDELSDTYELYALGLLEEPERSQLAGHLAGGCDRCTGQLRAALRLNAAILAAVPEVEPPRRLRRRLTATFTSQRESWTATLAWAGVSGALLAGLLWFSLQVPRLENELAAARNQVFTSRGDLRQVRGALALLAVPGTRQAAFGAENVPNGRVYVNGTRGILLLASQFPKPGPGQAYELWTVPRQGNPQPAGLFQPDENGNVFYLLSGALSVPDPGAIAISLEPEAGSPAPTTPPIVIAKLGRGSV